MGQTLAIQRKLQASLKIVAYAIFMGWLKSVNISIDKNLAEKLLKNCAGTIHLRLLFSVFRDPLWSKQLISLWCATPPQRVSNELKGAISGYLLNQMKRCFLAVLEQVSFFMVTIASIILFLFFFSKLLGNCQYWQAHLHIVVNSDNCTFSINTLLWVFFLFGLGFLNLFLFTNCYYK